LANPKEKFTTEARRHGGYTEKIFGMKKAKAKANPAPHQRGN
jgi:hypothetical protein